MFVGENSKGCHWSESLPTCCPHLDDEPLQPEAETFCILCNSKSWTHNELILYLLNKFMSVFHEAEDVVPIPFYAKFGDDVAKAGLSSAIWGTWLHLTLVSSSFLPHPGIALRGLSSRDKGKDGRKRGRIIPDWWQIMRKVCIACLWSQGLLQPLCKAGSSRRFG